MNLTVNINTRHLEKYINNLPRISAAIEATARDIEADAKVSIQRSSGQYRKYRRGKGKRARIHWSAPPNRAPNRDFGKLGNSIRAKSGGKYKYYVRANAKYAIPVELGHHMRNGKFVEPRPFLVPAMQRNHRPFRNRIRKIMGGFLW